MAPKQKIRKITVQHSEGLSEETSKFTQQWEGSDICFVVEDKKIYAMKAILSMWSPVFKAMFSLDFAERKSKEIKLPGKTFEEISILMLILHPPCDDINDDSVLTLLPLIEEYQILKLKEKCEKILLNQELSINNMAIAIRYDLQNLMEKTKQHLIGEVPMDRLENSPEFKEFDKEMIMEILFEKHKLSVRKMEPLRYNLCDNCPHGESIEESYGSISARSQPVFICKCQRCFSNPTSCRIKFASHFKKYKNGTN